MLDVAGVGYLVQVTASTSANLRIGQSTNLFTSMVIREDSFTLFGFEDTAAQKLFDLLRSVSGVGPKSALAILGAMSVDQIIEAVSTENDAAFKAVSGVGPKTAKLIGVTLAGKLGGNVVNASPSHNALQSTVVSALIGLGWAERTARESVSASQKALGESASANELLKYSLAQLGASKSIGSADE